MGLLSLFLKRVLGQDIFERYRDEIERLEQSIDQEKTSTGEGSFSRHLGGYLAEEVLALLETDDV